MAAGYEWDAELGHVVLNPFDETWKEAMKPNEYIEEVARHLHTSIQGEKNWKKQRAEDRDEFFRMADEVWNSRDHMLPVQTVEVPQSFFNQTGLTQDEFISTRYPGWDVEHVEYNTVSKNRVFVLKRNPRYLGQVVEIDVDGKIVQVAKEISEYSPEVDWETLAKERPDLAERLAKPRIVYDIDEVELERLFEETPEDAATLKRHLKVREPSLRATSRAVKDERTS